MFPRKDVLVAGLIVAASAAVARADGPKVGQKLERQGDEIVACGQLFHTTAPVMLWTDPGGYDAYRVERRFDAPGGQGGEATVPAGFGSRDRALSPAEAAEVRREGWTLDRLRGVVDQFVIHYDVCGTSRRCFQVLHDERNLSVQFMLDLDGTIYQTMDLKERAWHATKANTRSIGIEIANMGAYPPSDASVLAKWYAKGPDGRVRLVIPDAEQPYLHNPRASLRPARDEPVVGVIQGQELEQYDLTPEQYDSLVKLTATLAKVFPRIKLEAPRDASGKVIDHVLADDVYNSYAGVLGHYHVQENKTDPGPAFEWDRVIGEAKRLIGE